MIWVKRFSPLIVGALLWYGWSGYESYLIEKQAAYDSKIASVTAHLFVASAKYRDQTAVYNSYRDSLLKAWGVSADEIEAYPTRYGEEVLVYRKFAATIDSLVDSLTSIEDSIWRANDSVSVLDSADLSVREAALKRADSIRALTAQPRTR